VRDLWFQNGYETECLSLRQATERLLVEQLDHPYASLRRARNNITSAARRVLRYQKKAHRTSRERLHYCIRSDGHLTAPKRREHESLDTSLDLPLHQLQKLRRLYLDRLLQRASKAATNSLVQTRLARVDPYTSAAQAALQIGD